MNQEIGNYVMQKMSPFLDNGQTLRLERILEEVQLKQENGNDYEEDNTELLEKFIAAKRLEGRSDGTLNYYQFTVEKMFEDNGKNIRAITTEDLRDYLSRHNHLDFYRYVLFCLFLFAIQLQPLSAQNQVSSEPPCRVYVCS